MKIIPNSGRALSILFPPFPITRLNGPALPLNGAIKNGADGYILKKSSSGKILDTIQQVYDGDAALTPMVARQVMAFLKPVSAALPCPGRDESFQRQVDLKMPRSGYCVIDLFFNFDWAMAVIFFNLNHLKHGGLMNTKNLWFSSPASFLRKSRKSLIENYFSAGLLCLILICSSCEDEGEVPIVYFYPCNTAGLVIMQNLSADDVHLWIKPCSGFKGETINSGNKLSGDDHRCKLLSFYFEEEGAPVTLTVAMGQDGKTLKTVSCPVEPGAIMYVLPVQYTATWNGEMDRLELSDGIKTYYAN